MRAARLLSRSRLLPALLVATGTAGPVERLTPWEFHPICAPTTPFDDGDMGVQNGPSGRGFFVSSPVPVTAGARYRLSLECLTQDVPVDAVLGRVFWYRGPDRGRPSARRRYDDTAASGGTHEWRRIATAMDLRAPPDASLAVVRLESHLPRPEHDPVRHVAICGRAVYQKNWKTMLDQRRIAYESFGEWLDPDRFRGYRMVILCNTGPSRALTGEENQRIREYVTSGGHLLLVLATPHRLAGGRDLKPCSWIGARRMGYGQLFRSAAVLSTEHELTAGLEPGSEAYAYPGKLPGLRDLDRAQALIGTDTDALLAVHPLGRGRVTFAGNSPPDASVTNSVWQTVLWRAVQASGVTPGPERRSFTVRFRQVVFQEITE